MFEPGRKRDNLNELQSPDLLLDRRGEGELADSMRTRAPWRSPFSWSGLCTTKPRRLRNLGGERKKRPSPRASVEGRGLAAFTERRLTLPMTSGPWSGKLQQVRAAARPGYFNLIDLRFFIPARDVDRARFLDAASRAMESVLGQTTFARWVGDVDAELFAADDSRLLGLDELPAAVHRLIQEAQSAMPERPWHELDRAGGWAAVEYEPDEAADYADQCDLVAGISVVPSMWQNALSAIPFDSARHSRCGERFCYLKMDCASGWNYAKFADREEIEQALDASLRRGRLGSVVGGGAGLRYSYIELALADVTRAWREIREVLLEGRLPKRTWLLFHDAAISARWLGLYDDSPQPPRRGGG
jgi:hypothetical protein